MASSRSRPRTQTLLATAALLLAGRGLAQSPTDACLDGYETGQLLRRENRLIEARDRFRICSSLECPAFTRGDCVKWFQELSGQIASIVVAARDGDRLVTDARLILDGRRVSERLEGQPVEVDPGVRRIRVVRGAADAEAPCPEATRDCAETEVLAVSGDRNVIVRVSFATAEEKPPQALMPPAPAAPASPRALEARARHSGARSYLWLPAILGLASAGSAAAAVVLWRSAEGEARRLERSCAPFCTDEDRRTLRRELFWSDATAVGAVALLASGGVTFLLRPRRHGSSTAGQLRVGALQLPGSGALLIFGSEAP